MTSQAKRPEVVGKTGKGPRVGHLDSLTGILKEMAAVYREMRLGLTQPAEGSKLVFVLGAMRGVIETMSVERMEARLNELQAAAAEGNFKFGQQSDLRPDQLRH
jgi:hypothetical protein